MQDKKEKRKKTFSWRDIDITGGRSARTSNKVSWLNRNKQAYFKPCELRAADPLRGLVLRLTSQTPAKIKHTRLSKQLLANAEHGKNNRVMTSGMSNTLVIVRTYPNTAPTARERRERVRQRGWTTHQHLYFLQPRHIKAFSAHLSACACKSKGILWTCTHAHAHTHRLKQHLLCAAESKTGVGKVKDFAVDEGITRLSSLCQGRRGEWLFTKKREGGGGRVIAVSQAVLSCLRVTSSLHFHPSLSPAAIIEMRHTSTPP